MPFYVKPFGESVYGPYRDGGWHPGRKWTKLAMKALAFARIGSQTGRERALVWCPREFGRNRGCRLIRKYDRGQKTWPNPYARPYR